MTENSPAKNSSYCHLFDLNAQDAPMNVYHTFMPHALQTESLETQLSGSWDFLLAFDTSLDFTLPLQSFGSFGLPTVDQLNTGYCASASANEPVLLQELEDRNIFPSFQSTSSIFEYESPVALNSQTQDKIVGPLPSCPESHTK
ncbi:hypothetical protein N7456_008639 [Penicillium angulare]|uniref:Uncharacterized protein n=1 Tax=Penicillium angulare TaxID=116970 RepID=A0A9W9F321_9EURO|nr:hypothetical protein N7456_008639 [Penicillium angulare]